MGEFVREDLFEEVRQIIATQSSGFAPHVLDGIMEMMEAAFDRGFTEGEKSVTTQQVSSR